MAFHSRCHKLKHHYRAQGLSGAEKASDNRQRDRSENPDLFRKQPPHDELPVSSEGQSTHRLRRDGGCLQSTGQTTSWWRGHALDISRRSRRSSTQGCRPNQQPMERILAQNLLVRRGDRGRLYRLIILYIIWESHPHQRQADQVSLHRTLQHATTAKRLSPPADMLSITYQPLLRALSELEGSPVSDHPTDPCSG